MKKALKWALGAVVGVAAVAAIGVVGVYAASEAIKNQHWPKMPVTIEAAHDAGATARGAQLAKVYGCHDCHGADLAGRLFHDEPGVARITAANLTLAVAHQSDADLARAIRTGVAADGRGLWVMPSSAFSELTDSEVADLIAYLRTFTPKGEPTAGLEPGPVGRLGVVLGKFQSEPQMLKAALPHAFDAGPSLTEGRSMTRACTECHGADLKGGGPLKTPDLTIAASYDLDGFKRLMRTGVAAGERRLPMMSPTAVTRFSGWDDAQLGALHAYLRERAARMD